MGVMLEDRRVAQGSLKLTNYQKTPIFRVFEMVKREAERLRRDVLAPLLGRDPDDLRDQLCIGSIEHCAKLLSRYAAAGCQRVHLWPLGDEPRQIELAATALA